MKQSIHIVIIGFVLCGALTGCSSSLLLDSNPGTRTAINNGSIEHSACIGMRDGEIFSGYSVVIGKDSTQWFSDPDSKLTSVQTSQIAHIRLAKPNVPSGIIGGGLLGGAVGSLIGALSAPILAPDPSYPIGYPIGGMVIGGVVGELVGSGHTILYVSPNQEP
jgi:hypothetical protein